MTENALKRAQKRLQEMQQQLFEAEAGRVSLQKQKAEKSKKAPNRLHLQHDLDRLKEEARKARKVGKDDTSA